MADGGIYAVRNMVSGGFYIGSTNSFSRRWSYHRNRLARGAHDNQRLQRSWDKHGAVAFVFEPMCLVAPDDVLAVEQRLLDRLIAHPRCYNLSRQANGSHASPEGLERIRQANLGRTHSPETRAKIAAGNRRPKTPEARAAMSAAKKGRPSPHRGKRMSAAARANIRAGAVGRRISRGWSHTDQSKAKMSAAKMGNAHALGHTHSDEAKAKIAAAVAAAWARKRGVPSQ